MMKRKIIRLLACLALALLYVFVARPVFAQTVVYDRFVTSSGIEIATGPGYVSRGVNAARGQTIWDKAMRTADAGLPEMTGTQVAVNPSGNAVAVTAKARIPAVEIGKAVGRAGVNLGLKITGVIGAGLVLYDLAKEINFILSRNPDGSVNVEKTDLNICTVAPCFTYRYDGAYYNNVPYTTGPQASREAACSRVIAVKSDPANSSPNTQGWYFANPTMSGTTCFADLYNKEGEFQANISQGIATSTPTAPASSSAVPSSQQEFIDAVAAKSGWPSTSAVNRLLQEDIAAGNKLATGPITVTGPATSPGTLKTTTKADGSTVTSTTTHNHTYAGDKISTTNTTVVNNYNPTTNITTTETTVETPPKEDTPEDTAVSDTALPDLPKLYTPKYPEGITGVWNTKKTALTSTPLANLAAQLMPSVPAGGTCPVWNLPLNIGPWAYGVRNVAPACIIWDWCKVFIIAGALLLARALIFGG
jgi:hypothetical protein